MLSDRRLGFIPQCVDQGEKHLVAPFDPQRWPDGESVVRTSLERKWTRLNHTRFYGEGCLKESIDGGNRGWLRKWLPGVVGVSLHQCREQ